MNSENMKLYLLAGKIIGKSKNCGKKIKYKSEGNAERASMFLSRSGGHCKLGPYPCYFCDCWHIGIKRSKCELQDIIEKENKNRFRKVKTNEEDCDSCKSCAYYHSLKSYLYYLTGKEYKMGDAENILGTCTHLKSGHYNHIFINVHEKCSNYQINKKLENKQPSVILYGGSIAQIEHQLVCKHYWVLCIDDISRYYKCTECFCIERDMTEEEYYKKVGIDIK